MWGGSQAERFPAPWYMTEKRLLRACHVDGETPLGNSCIESLVVNRGLQDLSEPLMCCVL